MLIKKILKLSEKIKFKNILIKALYIKKLSFSKLFKSCNYKVYKTLNLVLWNSIKIYKLNTYPGYLGKIHYLLRGLYKNILFIVFIIVIISIIDLLSISFVAPLLISIFSNDLGSFTINIPFLDTFQNLFDENINHIIYLFSLLILIKGIVSLILNKVVLNFGVNFKNITRKKYLNLLSNQQFHKVQNKDSSFYLNLYNNLINKFAQTLMSIMRLSADFCFTLIIIYLITLDSQLVFLLGLFSIIFLILFDLIFRQKLRTLGKENQYDNYS